MGGVTQSTDDVLQRWRQVGFLRTASNDSLTALAKTAQRMVYAREQCIFVEGEMTAAFFLIEAGIVKLCHHSKDGREHILHFARPGETFNEVSVLDGGGNPATAIAHTDVFLWRVHHQDLHAIVVADPELGWAMIENLAGRARTLVAIIQNFALRSVRSRLARLLLDRAAIVEAGGSLPPLTQEEMAHHLGSVREVIGRTLRALADEGLITTHRRQIVVLDRERLQKEAER